MTRIAIMQPTFLPWIGYFDLIDQVDAFVYLDVVEFSKQSWHHRNRIKTRHGLSWLTLPVVHSQTTHTSLVDAQLGPLDATRKWRKTLAQDYARATCADTELPWIEEWLAGLQQGASLAAVNIGFIEMVCARLGIETPRVRASELPHFSGRAGRLVSICRHFNADSYLSPQGSAAYLKEDAGAFAEEAIDILFHDYEHPVYRQQHGAYLPYASVLDLLLNEGPASLDILRSGRRAPLDAKTVFDRVEAMPCEG